MNGAYCVAIALLVAASSRTAAESDQFEPYQAPNNDCMTPGDTVYKMLPRRVLRERPDLKDKLAVYASDEERTLARFSEGNSIAKGLEQTIIKSANVLRTDGEDVIANAAKPIKKFNRLKPMLEMKNSKHQHVYPTLDEISGHELHTTPTSKKSLVSSASAKRRGRDEPKVTVNTAERPVKKMQHDSRFARSGSTPTSAAAADGQPNKQLIARKAKNNGKNKRSDEVKIGNKKRQRIEPMPNNVGAQELHTTPNIKKYMVSVTKNAPVVLAKRLEPNKPKFIINNAVRSLKKHDFLSAPPDSFSTSAAAPDGRHNKQLIAQKPFEIDLNEHPNEVEVRNSQRQSIDPTPNSVGGQALHARPNFENALVSVANNAPFASADRLVKDEPTVTVNNAVRPQTEHGHQPAPSGSFTTSAAAPNGRLDKQLITQKAFKFDSNKHSDEVASHPIENPLHLREENEKYAHPATVQIQRVPVDWKSELARGPRVREKDKITMEARKFHEAFLQAFVLPFHQYPAETVKMLRIMKWSVSPSPNNNLAIDALRDLAYSQGSKRLRVLLHPDLEKLLGEEMTMRKNKETLRNAYLVKLFIMYELFYDFCHGNRILIDDLPKKSIRRDSILELST